MEVGVRVGMISRLESRIDPSFEQRHPRISFSGHVQLLFVNKPGGWSAMGFSGLWESSRCTVRVRAIRRWALASPESPPANHPR